MIIAIAHSIALLAMSYLIWKRAPLPLKNIFWPALLFKLFCGIALGLLYTYYYTVSDTFNYFDDARDIAQLLRDDVRSYFRFLWEGDDSFAIWAQLKFKQPRALFFSKITSVLCLLTRDNYWITALYFSFIVFLSTWYLVRYLLHLKAQLLWPSVAALLFFPSVVFWSSGVIKESISMAALYFLVVIFLKLYRREHVRFPEWILVFFSLWMLWSLKYYYFAVFLPVVSTALVMKRLIYPQVTIRHTVLKLLLWLIVFLIPLFVASRIHPNFYPERFLHVIVENYLRFQKKSDPGDMIVFNQLEPTPQSILLQMPKALWSGLFRPMFWEAHNPLQFLLSIENIFVLLLTVFALRNLRQSMTSPNTLLIFSVIVYVVLLCSFLALSTPNFGTLVRYRVGFLPFFILLISTENKLFTSLITFLERTFSRLVRNRT